jgi:hypothetical protein
MATGRAYYPRGGCRGDESRSRLVVDPSEMRLMNSQATRTKMRRAGAPGRIRTPDSHADFLDYYLEVE